MHHGITSAGSYGTIPRKAQWGRKEIWTGNFSA